MVLPNLVASWWSQVSGTSPSCSVQDDFELDHFPVIDTDRIGDEECHSLSRTLQYHFWY